jgi:adenosylhomocysteine nucleosidase
MRHGEAPVEAAFVAALEREIHPLVRHWRISHREHDGRRYKFFESANLVLVCGGIGAEAARRAAEAIISLYSPQIVWSVGFAGALDGGMKVGQALRPARVVDAMDGSVVVVDGGEGTLVTYGSVASIGQKAKLARAYSAQAVDMEAAAVARAAHARSVAFAAYKIISDESDFQLPDMERFIRNGKFRTAAFAAYAAIRPWLWVRLVRLAGRTSRAADALCNWLGRYDPGAEFLENKPAELHPIRRA